MKDLKIGDIVYNEKMNRLNIIISPLLDTKEKAREFMCSSDTVSLNLGFIDWCLLADKAIKLTKIGIPFYVSECEEGISLYINPKGVNAHYVGEL